MKKIFIFICLLLIIGGCASSGSYEDGYAAGYDAGYKAALALDNRSMPEYTPTPTLTPRATSAPRQTTTPAPDDFTVYVSRNGVIHKDPHCSGMKYYNEMLYSETKGVYDHKCSKCFK